MQDKTHPPRANFAVDFLGNGKKSATRRAMHLHGRIWTRRDLAARFCTKIFVPQTLFSFSVVCAALVLEKIGWELSSRRRACFLASYYTTTVMSVDRTREGAIVY